MLNQKLFIYLRRPLCVKRKSNVQIKIFTLLMLNKGPSSRIGRELFKSIEQKKRAKYLNKHFTKQDIQIENKYIKNVL